MVRRFLPSLAWTLMMAAPAFLTAQTGRAGVPGFEICGGYSYVFNTYNPTLNSVSVSGMNGWDASFKAPLLRSFFGIKGDVSGFYRADRPQFNPRTYFFLAGPQVGLRIRRASVFAHGMVGVSHLSVSAVSSVDSNTAFAMALGGGLDVGIARWLGWRITGDFYNTYYHAKNSQFDEITNFNGRISTGPVLRF